MENQPNNINEAIGNISNLEIFDDVTMRLEMRRSDLIRKGLSSNDPHEIMKANGILQMIEKKIDNPRKSMIVDPNEFAGSFGYKEKPQAMSYSMLHNMSKVPIINSIIKTRINQVAAFAEPQKDKYSTGFIVRKRRPQGDTTTTMSKKEIREANRITDFLLNCGNGYSFEGDQDLDTFVRKVMKDSLTYDQMTFQTLYDRRGRPESYQSVDATTMRIASSMEQQNAVSKEQIWQFAQKNENMPVMLRKSIKGYHPKYVQVYNDAPINAYYPWEMCFGVRNPTTSIYSSGYGQGELQDLVTTVTSLIWGEEYNRRFFKQGSIPKGLLRVSGQINDTKLQEFKREWNATMRGVYNAWKTPIMESDKVEWVDLQKSNRDMEYHSWMEFQIKVACAIFSIDPSEINFDIATGGSGGKPTFGGGEAERVQFSKDKGLYPLLKFLGMKMNRHVIMPLNPEYELVFVGMNTMSAKDEVELIGKKVSTYMTVDEVRAEQNLPALPNGEGSIILNPVFASARMAEKQQAMMNAAGKDDEDSLFNMKGFKGEDEDQPDSEEVRSMDKEENPIAKAFEDFFDKQLK
jgi:Phage portal protein